MPQICFPIKIIMVGDMKFINFVKFTKKKKSFYKLLFYIALNGSMSQLDNSCNSVVDLDSDVRMTETIQDIDPLSKGPLNNPVRNKLCGHIYGLDSVQQALQMNSHLR